MSIPERSQNPPNLPTNKAPSLWYHADFMKLWTGLYSVNETSARQAVVSPALQGRMNATFSFLVSGMLPLGALAGGALGERFGLRETIPLAAAGSVLSFLWVFFSPLRQMTRLPATPIVTPK